MLSRCRAVAVVSCLLVAVSDARAQAGPLAGLDDYVAKALKDWEVPGLSTTGPSSPSRRAARR